MNRKRMQRLLAAGLSAALALSLSACGGGATAAQDDNTTVAPSGESTDAAQPADYDNILIAYFTADENTEADAVSSASVTEIGGEEIGRVRAVADMIAAETGGELFSIQTSVEYPEDGGALIDYAAEEQDQNARPELTTHIENLDNYDTIFIGYPIWWGIAAWPVSSFVEANDFTGKTVIPFCTSSSSGLGKSGDLLEELAGTGAWLEGQRFRSSVSEADVAEWVNSLAL